MSCDLLQPGGSMMRGDNPRGGGAPLPPPPAPPAGMGFDSPSDQVSPFFRIQVKLMMGLISVAVLRGLTRKYTGEEGLYVNTKQDAKILVKPKHLQPDWYSVCMEIVEEYI